ncbi:cell division protein ZapC domain-containing protein [Pseudidiomarina sp.]|uniref:cell division protein ZapC domain-containing protein n=1 Tax=Pseudidiomarina sp. TaxID=2081707 RepID=UPI00299EC768|nr:cell division protein ZapC domain-containing protein [Pseudidiomarina sp.]MDX1705015.1 cell division protein ZapC [Pseudidiomarina sp.]
MQASQNWRWVFNPESQQLSIELGDGLVHTCPYKTSKLISMHAMNAAFNLEDAVAFQEMFDVLSSYDHWAPAQILQVSLNHVIFKRFGRPQMPQSWHFQQQTQAPEYPLQKGALVELNSGLTSATFVILNLEGEFAECMLLDKRMELSEIKSLAEFEVVKVLTNRLQASRLLQSASPKNADGSLRQRA